MTSNETPADVTTTATLRVVEALHQDVGLGRARVDAETRIKLKIGPGDIVEVCGTKPTGAIVWRSHPGDEGEGIIHIDNMVRLNAGTLPGNNVSISKISPTLAEEVDFVPDLFKDQQIQFGEGIKVLVKRAFQKRPVTVGDILAVPQVALFGQAIPFRVSGTKPDGIVVVGPETRVRVSEQPISTGAPTTVDPAVFGPVRDEILRARNALDEALLKLDGMSK